MEIRLVAWSEPAGKYDPKAPLEGNEDNMFVNPDLADRSPVSIQSDVVLPLGDFGCLMVVADGMGGMNAGEVASAIAIDTVKSLFAHDKISCEIASSPKGRKHYLETVIKEADRAVKNAAKQDPDKEGMGSTIILAWLADNGLTISWCGDSRAYLFNREEGLKPLSEDHSYVQDLVKARKLDYVDTFDHPQGNIITRSLGDPSKEAEPETREFSVVEGDIILLCSDGLSGVLRDRKTKDKNGEYYPGDNIEDIIKSHQDSLIQCRQALFDAAEKAEWYDNVTVILCQVVSGQSLISEHNSPLKTKKIPRKTFLWLIVSFLLIVIGSWFSYHRGFIKGLCEGYNGQQDALAIINIVDSLKSEISQKDSIISVLRDSLKIMPRSNTTSKQTRDGNSNNISHRSTSSNATTTETSASSEQQGEGDNILTPIADAVDTTAYNNQ